MQCLYVIPGLWLGLNLNPQPKNAYIFYRMYFGYSFYALPLLFKYLILISTGITRLLSNSGAIHRFFFGVSFVSIPSSSSASQKKLEV